MRGRRLAVDADARRWLVAAHARSFLDGLREVGVEPPRLVALTHSHWDHVLGAAALGVPVVAHVRTAAYSADLAKLDWSDEALEQRLAAGEVTQFHVDNVRQELPVPRDVRIASADIVFHAYEDLSFASTGLLRRRSLSSLGSPRLRETNACFWSFAYLGLCRPREFLPRLNVVAVACPPAA